MIVLQKANYELKIVTNSYVGNFERELVSYALGTLDIVQMEMGSFHGDYEMDQFWKEEFNSKRKDYYEDYELKDEYLMETYQDVDDWEQVTFYHMEGDCNILVIQLVKPLNPYWEEIVIRRIKKFFDIHPCKYDWTLPQDDNQEPKLVELFLVDANDNRIKEYVTKA